MLKEKPFANPGADDDTALVAEAEVLAVVAVAEERLPNEANGDEEEEAAPKVEVGVDGLFTDMPDQVRAVLDAK